MYYLPHENEELQKVHRIIILGFWVASSTVVAARLAHLFLDSPTLIAMYYLPYENGELKKIVLFTWHCNSLE